MKIYLGNSSPEDLRRAREVCPELSYGFGWSPAKMTHHDEPYFLDNGAYKAFRKNKVWDPSGWINRLAELREMPRDPDFIVLPDKVMDTRVTRERSWAWAKWLDHQGVEHPTAYSVQNGMDREDSVRYAKYELEADYIFVGGDKEWKRATGDEWVMTAHDYGLKCHIARPGSERLAVAASFAPDSMDTSSIARNRTFDRLRNIVEQRTLEGDPL